jgi:REP element-mobilizing transposase RayT
MAFTPYNPDEAMQLHRQKLPHWRQWGRTYFVTSRLGDSVPKELSDAWRVGRDAWLHAHGIQDPSAIHTLPEEAQKEYHREFTAKFHDLLDAGHGACVLANPNCAEILIGKFKEGNGTAYHLDAWCIMPNHFHALVEPIGSQTLGAIVKQWKGGSAFLMNQILVRKGSIWQAEPYDHIARSEAQLDHFRRYIANNPTKANLHSGFVVGMGVEKCSYGL